MKSGEMVTCIVFCFLLCVMTDDGKQGRVSYMERHKPGEQGWSLEFLAKGVEVDHGLEGHSKVHCNICAYAMHTWYGSILFYG